jgi:hypothetical protein
MNKQPRNLVGATLSDTDYAKFDDLCKRINTNKTKLLRMLIMSANQKPQQDIGLWLIGCQPLTLDIYQGDSDV